ncbi:hypothetical protein [Jannaschia sp. AI_61]|uniref:hypothetical protein n=1 Tax=Jannaschia sp. AI_61 TaxID=2829796 RepID=UPI001C7D1FB5|nr:hypothetical protein [Jannaschia sp. AI_61]
MSIANALRQRIVARVLPETPLVPERLGGAMPKVWPRAQDDSKKRGVQVSTAGEAEALVDVRSFERGGAVTGKLASVAIMNTAKMHAKVTPQFIAVLQEQSR